MHTLEICQLRLIPRFDQRIKSSFDQRRYATAQHRLFTEQIGLCFCGDRGWDHTGSRASDRFGVCQSDSERIFAAVISRRNEARHTGPSLIFVSHHMPLAFGGNQQAIDARRGLDQIVVKAKAMAGHHNLARFHMRTNVGGIDGSVDFVGQHHIDDVCLRGRFRNRHRLKRIGDSSIPA